MKAMDVREMEDIELQSKLGETRRELFNLRFQSVTGRLDNYSRLRELRHDLARMATVLREREIARAEGRFEDAAPVVAPTRAGLKPSGESDPAAHEDGVDQDSEDVEEEDDE